MGVGWDNYRVRLGGCRSNGMRNGGEGGQRGQRTALEGGILTVKGGRRTEQTTANDGCKHSTPTPATSNSVAASACHVRSARYVPALAVVIFRDRSSGQIMELGLASGIGYGMYAYRANGHAVRPGSKPNEELPNVR